MTHEDKQLLLVDLCARLPYKLKVKVPTLQEDAVFTLVVICEGYITIMKDNGCCFDIYNSIEVFPFLRQMSSMTEDEKEERASIVTVVYNGEVVDDNFINVIQYVDWLNSHNFDYRDLILKGLALEALEEMYK